jgi:hypothetical protein
MRRLVLALAVFVLLPCQGMAATMAFASAPGSAAIEAPPCHATGPAPATDTNTKEARCAPDCGQITALEPLKLKPGMIGGEYPALRLPAQPFMSRIAWHDASLSAFQPPPIRLLYCCLRN